MAFVIDLNQTKTNHWIRYLRNRVARNKNFVGLVVGPTGSGKSYSAVSIGEMMDPTFTIDRIVFQPVELMNQIQNGKLKPGSVIVFEEVGIAMDSANWQTGIIKMLKYVLETFRHRRFILLMTVPNSAFLFKSGRMLLHGLFEMQGIDKANNLALLKPKLCQYSDLRNKMYYKYLRVVGSTGARKLKVWAIPKPSEPLRLAYEAKKKAFTDQLYDEVSKFLINPMENKYRNDSENFKAICDRCKMQWSSRTIIPNRCPKCSSPKTHLVDEKKEDKGIEKNLGGVPDGYLV